MYAYTYGYNRGCPIRAGYHRVFNIGADALRNRKRTANIRLGKQYGKFLAAPASREIGRAHKAFFQNIRDNLQY